MSLARIAVAFAGLLTVASSSVAQTIATAELRIAGAGLRVVDLSVSTALNVPITVQTEFAGKRNQEAPAVNGLVAAGDLVGPGIDVPLRLETAPGYRFHVPGLAREGTYFLQNIRLLGSAGELLQSATPSVATITVASVLDTKVTVRQLTPAELRARGISIDARNETAYVRRCATVHRRPAGGPHLDRGEEEGLRSD